MVGLKLRLRQSLSQKDAVGHQEILLEQPKRKAKSKKITFTKIIFAREFLNSIVYSATAATEESEPEVKTRKRSKEEEKEATVVVMPARKSARLAKPN